MLEETAAGHAAKPALHQPLGGGKYRTYTWAELRDRVQWTAVGLTTIGVKIGDIVALQSETRAEFYFADLGVMAAGAISAALYTSLPYAEQANALRFCEARVAMVENPKAMQGLLNAMPEGAPALQWILLTGETPGAITLNRLIEKGQRRLAADPEAFDRIRASFDDQALAVLYMTSGATGEPKMGLVTHAALVINIDMTPAVLPLTPDDCTVAFLPSAHIAQRVVGELMPLRTGSSVWFSEGLSKLPTELRTARPTFFLSPPRVWERMYSSILAEIKKRPAPLRKMFYLALGMGSRAAQLRRDGRPVPPWIRSALALFDKIIFNKIRERLGGRLRFPISGAAPLSKDLAEFYEAIGMPILEGYGLTEGGVVSGQPHRSRQTRQHRQAAPARASKSASKKMASCSSTAPSTSPVITRTPLLPPPSSTTAGSRQATSPPATPTATTTSPAARRNSSSPPTAKKSTPPASKASSKRSRSSTTSS